MDKIKLLLDEDIHATLSSILKKRGFEVVHTQEVKGKGRSDKEQLLYASQQQRCLMSFNVRDFVLLRNKYVKFSSITVRNCRFFVHTGEIFKTEISSPNSGEL